MNDLHVGDEIEQHFGPYKVVAEVVAIREEGAVLSLPFNAVLVGYDKPITAPNGTALTEDVAQGFLGRAHWPAAKIVRAADDHQ